MSQAWNFAGIASGVQTLNASVNTIHQLLDDGQSALSRLSSVWGGSGSESYRAVQQRWDATSKEMNEALQGLSQAIGESGEAMQHTESGVAGMFGG
jgi:early secretory antigenic target protein ESAT-6